MAVRAKFTVQRIERYITGKKMPDGQWGSGEVNNVVMTPVTGGNGENESFFASTPSGKIELGIINPDALEQFDLQKSYYVDFTPAD